MQAILLGYGTCWGRRSCPEPRSSLERSGGEQGTRIGGHAQGRICIDVGWEARAMGRQRPSFWGLGDLPPERIARQSGSALRVAIDRLVRPTDSAFR